MQTLKTTAANNACGMHRDYACSCTSVATLSAPHARNVAQKSLHTHLNVFIQHVQPIEFTRPP